MVRAIAPTLIGAAAAVVVWMVLTGDREGVAALVTVRDCEAFHRGAVAQPTNAWSSLALTAVGGWTAARAEWRAIALGSAVAVVGLASYTAHATLPDGPTHLDGAAITALGATVVVIVTAGRLRLTASIVGAVTVGAAALIDDAATGLSAAGVLTGIAAVALTHRGSARTGRSGLVALSLLGAAWVLWLLSGESGPLCRPQSWWQWHAGWHVAAAGGLAALGRHLLPVSPDNAGGTSTLDGVDHGV